MVSHAIQRAGDTGVVRPKIFLSAGRTETPQQDAFLAAVTQYFEDDGFDVVRALWSSEQPLKPIWRKMQECAGTAVIAFERLHFESGIEFRGGAKQKTLENVSVPTVWNQIEATMAYTLGHPLLVVVQDGLRDEGLLEGRYDWYVQRVPLDPGVFSQREFRGVCADWKARVMEAQGQLIQQHSSATSADSAHVDPDALTVGQLVSGLKATHLWGLIVAIVTALAAVFGAGFALGGIAGPR